MRSLSLSLSDFSGVLRCCRVTLPNGKTVEARELTAADDRAVREVMPPPEPPRIKDPTKGSNAPKIEDADDPGYRRAFNEWFSRFSIVRVACSLGYAPAGHQPWDRTAPAETRKAWAAQAYDELTGALSNAEISRIYDEIRALAEQATEGVGLGNSGGGGTMAPNPSPPSNEHASTPSATANPATPCGDGGS